MSYTGTIPTTASTFASAEQLVLDMFKEQFAQAAKELIVTYLTNSHEEKSNVLGELEVIEKNIEVIKNQLLKLLITPLKEDNSYFQKLSTYFSSASYNIASCLCSCTCLPDQRPLAEEYLQQAHQATIENMFRPIESAIEYIKEDSKDAEKDEQKIQRLLKNVDINLFLQSRITSYHLE